MLGLSAIMPAYNEEERIINTLRESIKVFKSLKSPFEILVINDGSIDNTAKLVRKFAKKNKCVKLVSYRKNKGKGNALRYGFNYAKMNLVTFIDADLELHPNQLKNFLKIMKETGCDVVIGSKRHPESELFYPWHRKFLSYGYYFMNKLLFGLPLKDTQSGLKLFKKKVLDHVFPKIVVKGYAFDLEILVLAYKFGYKIHEAPIKLDFKRAASRVGFKSIKNILVDTLGIFYRFYILKYYR